MGNLQQTPIGILNLTEGFSWFLNVLDVENVKKDSNRHSELASNVFHVPNFAKSSETLNQAQNADCFSLIVESYETL